jgi:transposase-like protein
MRYPASEKLEIIRLVEQSHLPVRGTLEKLGIQPARFYRWYDRLQTGGPEALEDKSPRPKRVWNRIPEAIRKRIVQLALDEPELSPRELATRFTDTASYFVSEASVYRLLKAYDLISSPAYIVMKAADEFKDKTTAPRPHAPRHRSSGRHSRSRWWNSRHGDPIRDVSIFENAFCRRRVSRTAICESGCKSSSASQC